MRLDNIADILVDTGIRFGLIDQNQLKSPDSSKNERIDEITKKKSWMKENRFLLEAVAQATFSTVSSPLEAFIKLEDATVEQLRFIQDYSLLHEWNANPVARDNRDEVDFSAGGLMGRVRNVGSAEGWKDMETGRGYRIHEGSEGRAVQLKFLPLGVDHRVEPLAREASRLLAIDMPRLCDTIISHKQDGIRQPVDFAYAYARFHTARLLHEHYGFRIHKIWEDYHDVTSFHGWDKLEGKDTVTALVFASNDDILNRVWDRANDVMEKVVRSAHVRNRSRYTQFEISLRKLAIAVGNTKRNIVDSKDVSEWWDIYKPQFERRDLED